MTDALARKEGGSDVAHYDPQRGLRTIAVAEAAEKHWRRAKNTDKLFEAIKQKLTRAGKICRLARQQGGAFAEVARCWQR